VSIFLTAHHDIIDEFPVKTIYHQIQAVHHENVTFGQNHNNIFSSIYMQQITSVSKITKRSLASNCTNFHQIYFTNFFNNFPTCTKCFTDPVPKRGHVRQWQTFFGTYCLL